MAKRLARSSQPWAKGPSPRLNASSAARSACSTAAPNSPCAELGMSMCESLVVIRFGASVLEEAPSVELSPSRMMGPFHDSPLRSTPSEAAVCLARRLRRTSATFRRRCRRSQSSHQKPGSRARPGPSSRLLCATGGSWPLFLDGQGELAVAGQAPQNPCWWQRCKPRARDHSLT